MVKNAEQPPLKLSLLDRAITYFNPAQGVQRMRSRAVMAIAGSYLGARRDRRATMTWTPYGGSADDDTIIDLPELRARSRDLVRNSPIATGAVLTLTMNVVGLGLSLQALPDWEFLGMTEQEADDWKAIVQREFRTWAESEDCDATRTQNFYGLQRLTFRSALESGDCFVLMPMIDRQSSPYSLALQVIEADRIDDPTNKGGRTISGGVELDLFGAPVAYHILKQHPGTITGFKRETDRVPAFGPKTGRRNVIHVFDRTRPGQNRQVPYLAPIMEPLKQLDRYTEAELMAAVVSGMLAVFVKTDTGEGFPSTPNSVNNPDTQVPLESGTITDLRPGEDVVTVNPNRPNQAFDPFVQSILRQIGASLGLPAEVLMKQFVSSYSAARAAMLEAWKLYKLRRELLAEKLCAPVYEAWMEEAVALGRVSAPGFFDDPMIRRAYLQSEWIGDAPGQIDPNKEAEASKTLIEMELSSRQRETMRLTGAEWKDIHREQVQEKQMRDRDGMTELPAGSAQPQEMPNRTEEPATKQEEEE